MTRHPDPCYCEQSQDYEGLLLAALMLLRRYGSKSQLIDKIEATIDKYNKAQKEYKEDDNG